MIHLRAASNEQNKYDHNRDRVGHPKNPRAGFSGFLFLGFSGFSGFLFFKIEIELKMTANAFF